jgi:AIPR protein
VNVYGTGRQILVRVIETRDEEIAAQVIKATNSQNQVSAASLRSAEPFQRSIEDYFLSQGLYYERKRNHYKNLKKPRTKTVEIPELAQAVASILLQEPHVARGTPSALVRASIQPRVQSEDTASGIP